jgi:putative transposase
MQNSALPQRRSIRLQGYDYSQGGAYFVTICTHDKVHLFGTVGANHHSPGLSNIDSAGHDDHDAAVMTLNDAGLAVNLCWLAIPDHFPAVELDAFIIMPNHVHGILSIQGDGVNNDLPLRAKRANDDSPGSGTSSTIGSVVRGFKIGVTKWFRENRPEIHTVWQRNYYEHVIRNDAELDEKRQYIVDNPARVADR